MVAIDAMYVALRKWGEFGVWHWSIPSAFLCFVYRKSRREVVSLENLSVVLQATGRWEVGKI